MLDWEKEADRFYEGRYATQVHFDMARLLCPGGRILLHFLVFGYYEAILGFVPNGSSMLDIGCAGGSRLIGQWARATGLDISLQALEIAASKYDVTVRADVRKVDFGPASFDAIISSFFWEHIRPSDKDLLLEKFHRWLRPGGKAILIFDVASENALLAWARRQPELYRECFLENDGHYGLEPASAAMRRFSDHGFCLRWWHAMNRSPLQHLPVLGWLAPYGRKHPWVRLLTSFGTWVSSHVITHRVYTGGLQLFDDTVGRLLPLDWARLLLVVLERND